MVAEFADPDVKVEVQARIFDKIALRDRLDHPGPQAMESRDIFVRNACSCLRGTQALDAYPHLEDLDGLVHGNSAYPGSAVRQALHQSFASKFEQRGAYGGPARRKRSTEVCLDEPLVGCVLTPDDRVPDEVGDPRVDGGCRFGRP